MAKKSDLSSYFIDDMVMCFGHPSDPWISFQIMISGPHKKPLQICVSYNDSEDLEMEILKWLRKFNYIK